MLAQQQQRACAQARRAPLAQRLAADARPRREVRARAGLLPQWTVVYNYLVEKGLKTVSPEASGVPGAAAGCCRHQPRPAQPDWRAIAPLTLR
jgi:hypothetical protein